MSLFGLWMLGQPLKTTSTGPTVYELTKNIQTLHKALLKTTIPIVTIERDTNGTQSSWNILSGYKVNNTLDHHTASIPEIIIN